MFVKLQIEKSQHSGDLMLTINFDKNAPNFSIDKNMISWSPTFEELDFVIETFEIISKRKNREGRCEKEIRNAPSHFPSDNKKEESSNESSERKIAMLEPSKVEFNDIKKAPDFYPGKKADEKGIFVQVDDKTIDEALKRKGIDVEEVLILDEEDKSIIDKMLKKRGKEKDKI